MKHKTRTKALSWLLSLALVLGLFPGMSLTAYADTTEELLTTITATGKEQASYSVENVATVSFSYTAQGSSAYMNNGKTNWGWWGYGWTATVNAVEGYTITKCVFYDDADRTATDSSSPFEVKTTEEDKTPQVNGTPILANQSKGITKIEVYGYASHTHSFTYTANGDTITATCGATDKEANCSLKDNNYQATLTIAKPLHTNVGDGMSADARITDANNIKGDAAVSYYKANNDNTRGDALNPQTTAPTDGGKYWAEITLTNEGNAGTATAHVVYEIANPDYTITVPAEVANGTVTADKTSAKYGEAVTLTVTPETGFTIKTVKYNDTAITVDEGVYSFTMPAANVTVSAAFEGKSYGITVNSSEHGTVTAGGTAKYGSVVTLTVTPSEGYQLDTLTVKDANNQNVTVTNNKFTMPASNVTVAATFKEITYTVTANGATATVTDSTPEQHTYTAELKDVPADKTYDGEPVNLAATSVQKSAGFPDKVTVGTVSFKDQNDNTVTTATDVGTYTASATVGDKTISKSFTINGQTTPITYVKTTKSGSSYTAVLATTNQYIPLVNNPNGITLLREGRIYYAKGNIEIGALVFIGNDVKLILGKDTTVTIYAGIYHIGSSLEIYPEEGTDNSVLIVKGNQTLSSLNNYTDFNDQTISDTNATLSGTIGVYGGKLTVEQGNSNLVSEDISLTLGVGVSESGLTGGTENSDGSMTYGKAAFASLTSLAVKPIAVVTAAPTAKTGLTANGSAQALVNAGTANGGTMQYALGTSSAATGAYSTTIPTATAAGTYYVWYKAVGSDGDSAAAYVTVTISAPPTPPAPTTYSVTVNNGTGGGSYTAGATVTITADAAPEGKVFDKWTGSVSFADATSASTTFTMPASAVTVTATYKDKPSIADMTVYDIPDQSSTGEQITPKPVVKYLGHLLTEGTDYELSYGKNTELGEGTVTITGKGNYTGSLTKTFKIVLAAYGGTLTVAAPGAYTYGDALGAAPSVNSTGSLTGETVTVYYAATPSGEGTAWNSSAKLNAGTYYVWAELAKTATHDAATSARVTFTVSKATPAAPSGVLAASYTDTYKVTLSIPGDKTYADYEYSLDGDNWTSVPALKDGAFTPAGLSAGTTYTLSLRTKADSNNNASAAATATLKTPAKVLLSYDANGSTATVPASAEYDSGATVTAAAAITRAGYTFAGWNTAANGGGTAYAAGAAFTISANTTLCAQWTPITYSVDYHENGGNACTDETGKAYNAEITLPTPTYAEHTFNGWATVSGGSPVYRGGQKVSGLTSVNGATVDLYAVWTENTYKITGEVKEERDGTTEQSIVAGVTVKIMRGSVEFATTATDDYGKYTFSGVPAGSYNIVATRTVDGKNQTMTALVEVKSDKTVETIVLPPSGVNSALKVTGDSTPPVMVGGLDDVAKDEAEENKEVTVTMTVEQKDENTATEQQKQEMQEIKEAVAADSTTGEGRTELEFLDVKVEKKTEGGSTTTTEPITETSQVVEMIVPFNMNGRFGFSLYRHHDGKAEAFRSMSSRFAKGSFADGYFFADKAAGLFYIYTSRFSTYAIGYEEGTGYTLTVTDGTGSGEFAAGATITITADDPAAGKVFDKWTTGDGVDFADETASTTTFVMPAKDVTVTATYKDAPVTTYTATVVSGTGSGSYAAGASVTIKANPAPSGKVFDKWVSSDGVSFANANSSTTTFTMPAKNVTVTATYKTASSPAPYYPGGGGNYTPTTYPPIVADAQHGKVTISPTNPTSGTTVTITAKPDTGYEVDTVSVADASGKSVSVKDNGNNTYSFTQPSSKVTVKVTFKPVSSPTNDVFTPFSDLNTASWYADGVRYVLEHGIMSGMGNGQFAPNGTTTRAQLAQILWNMEGKPATAGALNFTDVNPSEWYAAAIRWANAEGIIGGYGNNLFGPNDALTREQLVTILYRYAKYKGIDVSVGEDTNILSYDDAFDISEWAIPAMQWAVGSGLISGKTASTLNPQDKASRAEIATIIMRYCEEIAK